MLAYINYAGSHESDRTFQYQAFPIPTCMTKFLWSVCSAFQTTESSVLYKQVTNRSVCDSDSVRFQ